MYRNTYSLGVLQKIDTLVALPVAREQPNVARDRQRCSGL